ncbi:MAG TPA: ATP-binding protein [Verrucomicrobiae bacterium]|nr:ATP-binding protein [Verrucomicrobiae bacterium]
MTTENATTETAVAIVPKFNQTLRTRLLELRAGPKKDEYSNNKMAKRLGVNTSYVSQFCNGVEFAGDLDNFHKKLDDWFRNEARRKASGVTTIMTGEAKRLHVALDTLRKLNEIGCIVMSSGGGKTRGEELYAKENNTVIHFQVRSWNNDKGSLESALFKAIGSAGYDYQTKRAQFMVQKMTGSDRMLIIGDAHKLTKKALQWVVDFWEETQIPIALVGTQQMHDLLMSDTQRFSRIQFWDEIIPDSPRQLIEHLAKSLMPDINGELDTVIDLGKQIVQHEGLYRSVYKQFKLAAEIKATSHKPLNYERAIRVAHTKLLRGWDLEMD